MTEEYHSIGDPMPDLDPARLAYDETRRLLAACLNHPAFEVIELRQVTHSAGNSTNSQITDGIVVECCDGTVPSRNAPGIKNRERLMLLYRPGRELPYEVVALRTAFPYTLHQNQVWPGQPASLCLYFEPWSAIERGWTPAKHLQRILWWLRETANGTLHRSDQPLERLYFQSEHLLVLPADFDKQRKSPANVLRLIYANRNGGQTLLRAVFAPAGVGQPSANDPGLCPLVISVTPAMASGVQRHPWNLGELHDQLLTRQSEFVTYLKAELQEVIPSAGLPLKDANVTDVLLLLQIPVTSEIGATAERVDIIGFLAHGTNLGQLSVACGVAFDGKDGKAYANNLTIAAAAGTAMPEVDTWRAQTIEPLDVRLAFTAKNARKASGVPDENAEFQGVLAGVGALGSCMAELWFRAGWGNWTFVDDDKLLPHNLVRHIGKDTHIGMNKVDVVANLSQMTWPTRPRPAAIPAKITSLDDNRVSTAIAGANLLVDTTTTLEAPRDLSSRDGGPRLASAFFTPSGRDSVLLLEDASRNVPLFALEGQYYRAVLNSSWGNTHLNGHHGTYWVGGGCRDLSGILSNDIVQLHGSTLARQLRLLSANSDAQIRVWSMDFETGSIACIAVPVEVPQQTSLGGWRIVSDEGIEKKLKSIRAAALPNETGGVILGFIDQKLKTIHVVDVLSAPADSAASQSGFVRGADGVREAIERAAALTANIVGYIGEWHSHPPRSTATPSNADVGLLAYLADSLKLDGMPALMIIASETEISFTIGEGAK